MLLKTEKTRRVTEFFLLTNVIFLNFSSGKIILLKDAAPYIDFSDIIAT